MGAAADSKADPSTDSHLVSRSRRLVSLVVRPPVGDSR